MLYHRFIWLKLRQLYIQFRIFIYLLEKKKIVKIRFMVKLWALQVAVLSQDLEAQVPQKVSPTRVGRGV